MHSLFSPLTPPWAKSLVGLADVLDGVGAQLCRDSGVLLAAAVARHALGRPEAVRHDLPRRQGQEP